MRRILSWNGSGSFIWSTQLPSTSNFQPWYTQRRPHSSLRPNHKETRRWGQNSSTKPMRPAVSRKATSFSPSSCTRTGGQSGSGISQDRTAGIQYRRMVSPMAVPASVWVRSAFSSTDSISRVSFVHIPSSVIAQEDDLLSTVTRASLKRKDELGLDLRPLVLYARAPPGRSCDAT